MLHLAGCLERQLRATTREDPPEGKQPAHAIGVAQSAPSGRPADLVQPSTGAAQGFVILQGIDSRRCEDAGQGSQVSGIRVEDARPCHLELYLDRLAAAAAHFGFAMDRERVRCEVGAALQRSAGSARARVTVDVRGIVRVELASRPNTPARPLPVVLAAHAISAPAPFFRHKTTRRDHYEQFAADTSGTFDTLLWNERGEVTEFTRGNVILELASGEKVTPPLQCGLLDGVGRACELAGGRVREAMVRIDGLSAVRRIWFVNALRGLLPVYLHNGLGSAAPAR